MANVRQTPQPLPRIPEENGLDLEQYRLRSPAEIARLLHDLAKHRELLTVHFDGLTMLTSLLAVEPENQRFYLDDGLDETLNRRLAQAGHLTIVGRHNRVWIQFQAKRADRTELHDGPAFVVPFPDSILRVQRRDFFRLTTPLATRPRCEITLEDGSRLTVSVLDISLGGACLLDTESIREALWSPGRVLRNCLIELPGEGKVGSDIEVRSIQRVALPNGQPQYRIGCRFLQTGPRMNADIQRYIHKIELERRRIKTEK